MYYTEYSSTFSSFLKEDRNLYAICVTEHNVLQN